MKNNQKNQNTPIKLQFLILGVLVAILLYGTTRSLLLTLSFFILGISFSIAYKGE